MLFDRSGVDEGNVRALRACRAPMMRVSLAALLLGSGGCMAQPEETAPPQLRTVLSALVGQDGPLTVSAANTVVNQYAQLTVSALAGTSILAVNDVGLLDSPSFGPLAAGDLLLVIQMQGATID